MSRTRVSRGLVFGVGIVIAVGGVFYLRRSNKSVASPDKGGAVAQSVPGGGSGAAAGPSAQAAPAAVVPAKMTGQIALPGSVKAIITTTTPGGAESARTVAPAASGGSSGGTSNQKNPTPQGTAVKPAAAAADAAPPVPAVAAVAGKLPTDDAAPAAISATPVADGKAQIDSGNLVAGRRILNDALMSGRLADP